VINSTATTAIRIAIPVTAKIAKSYTQPRSLLFKNLHITIFLTWRICDYMAQVVKVLVVGFAGLI